MYPNLYYAFKDLFGVEIEFLKMFQSFGFFVAVAFFLAGYFFTLELKRKEKDGLLKPVPKQALRNQKITPADYAISALIGIILGYKLVYIGLNFHAFLENTQTYILSLKGNLLGGLIGGAIASYLKFREAQKVKGKEPVLESIELHPYEHVGSMTTIAALAGILGAKIFHNLENWGDFMADPIGSIFSFSGLTMYGGLICGSAAVIYYANKNKIAVRPLIDACAPGLMLAYGVGRFGCQIAGDGDWGINNLAPKPSWLSFLPDWTWSYTYPHNVLHENQLNPIPGCTDGPYCFALQYPVFPTALYEATTCILLFFVLWSLRKKIQTPGVLFSTYLVMNGVERFFIEKIRINTQYHIFGFGITQAEIISSTLFILGVIGIWWFRKNRSAPATAKD